MAKAAKGSIDTIDPQIKKLAAEHLRSRYQRFYTLLLEHSGEEYIIYCYGLFIAVYELSCEGKYMAIGQASRYTHLTHPATIRKHFDASVEAGFLKLEPNPSDGRSSIIKPGPRLEPFVKAEIDTLLQSAEEMAKALKILKKGSAKRGK